MARLYAGILGLLAFTAVVAAGVIHAAAPGTTVWQAVVSLFTFAAIGYVVGSTAQWIIDDSVRGRLTRQLEDKSSTQPQKKITNETAIAQ